MSASPTIARLAPSPTGAQHLGNARSFLLAWLSARRQNGELILRIEDIDSPRVKPWAQQQAIDDLHWLGLDWDQGPDTPGSEATGPFVQSERLSHYETFLGELRRHEAVYPCTCSRTDIAEAASAPHWEHEGPVYPGTCRSYPAAQFPTDSEDCCWRFRCLNGTWQFVDGLRGAQSCDLAHELGDFVVARRGGLPAYQLAVVIDDHEMGVTEVVRGDDLLASTFRQLQLYASFGWPAPTFYHVPLVVGPDGRRLAKRHGDSRLSTYRDQGIRPQRIIGLLAWSLGLTDQAIEISPRELHCDFAWEHVTRREAFVFDAKCEAWLTGESQSLA